MRIHATLLSLMFLLGGFASLVAPAPPAAAQDAGTCQSDATTDQTILAPSVPDVGGLGGQPGDSTQQTEPSGVADHADITQVCLGNETDRKVTLTISIAEMLRPNTLAAINSVDVFTCFTYTGNGAQYRLFTRYSYNPGVFSTESEPLVGTTMLVQLDGDCPGRHAEAGDPYQDSTKIAPNSNVTTTVDPSAGTITTEMLRATFADKNIQPGEATTAGPEPTAGDQFTGISTTTRVWGLGANYPIVEDTTDPFDFGFTIATGEAGIRLQVIANVNKIQGVTDATVPTYGVDVGSFQTVPVDIFNKLDRPIVAALNVSIVEGEASQWDVRIIPAIPVPATSGEGQGNTTVTLIVNSAPSIRHKETVRIQIRANVQDAPDIYTTALVDVVGVVPPDVQQRQVYFHATGRPCQPEGRWWFNTLEQDPLAENSDLPYQNCAAGGGGAAGGEPESLFRFTRDVPHARHYTLDALQSAEATVAFKSTLLLNPPTGETPVVVPIVADVIGEIFSGDVVIGRGVAERVEIGDGTNSFQVPIDIFPENRLATTRYVPDERPLNVAFTVVPQQREIIVGEGTPAEQTHFVNTPAGNIKMVLPGSSLTVPIIESERAGDIINVTKSGALVSLRVQGEKTQFMNPEKTKVFRFTVRNEGLNPDTITIGAAVNRTGWAAKVSPKTVFDLGVGDPASFELWVKVPASAAEEEAARIAVTAVSTVDPEATARVSVVLKATRGTIIPDEQPDFNATGDETTEESPAPSFMLTAGVLGLFALAAVAWRRRD